MSDRVTAAVTGIAPMLECSCNECLKTVAHIVSGELGLATQDKDTELATLRRRVAELEGENRDATEALRRALRQWKSYYESFGVELSQGVDDDLEPIATPKEDYDLETAKHPEGDLYRWCAKQLAILEARQPALATENQG